MESKNEVRITGVLTGVSVETTKNGKEIARLIIDTDPPAWKTSAEKNRVPVTVIGKTILAVKHLKPGTIVSMIGRVDGNEFKEKLYCNIIGEQFKTLGTAPAPTPPPSEDASDDSEVPF